MPPPAPAQDLAEARRWWNRAAAGGDPAAKAWIGDLDALSSQGPGSG